MVEPEKAPLVIVKRSEEELLDKLTTERGFIEQLCKHNDQPIEFESYQRDFLDNRSRFRWVTKSRQVGMSFVAALEALARCHLRPAHESIFVSYAREEAKEKVALARQVYESLPLEFQKKLISDSKQELEFQSNGAGKGVSRISSLPSKPPRGKHGDVMLDELAHLMNDRDVYTGSTALIARGDGQLTGCSTPLGRRGVFWEIATQEMRPYPQYSRQFIPWWLCTKFCSDSAAAAAEADQLSTQDMVERFGRPALVEQWNALGLEEFEQEFCAKFVDASYAFYPLDLILSCTPEELDLYQDFTDIPRPEGRLIAGFDVGRTRDHSELAVFEEINGHYFCRLLRGYEQTPFKHQESDLRSLLAILPVARLSIDRSGIGMNLAENLARDYPQVVAENFTNETKERWATDLKILFQQHKISLPRDRLLVSQIHAIKRAVLPSGRVSFDAERTERAGHADRFWAIALACQKERAQTVPNRTVLVARIIGPTKGRQEFTSLLRLLSALGEVSPFRPSWLSPF